VSGGVTLPSAKALHTGKGAAKGVTPPEPQTGKGAGPKGADSDAWAAKKTMVLTPKAKPAPAEAKETPAVPAPEASGGIPRPGKFQPASKAKAPEPKAEPPNGKGAAAKGGKEPAQKAVIPPTQKGSQKGNMKGVGKAPEKGKADDGGKGQPAQPVQKGKSKGKEGKETPREPSTPPPVQAQTNTGNSGAGVVVSGRMKTLEFQTKKVVQEWKTLPEEQKPLAMQMILDRIIEAVPPEQQRYAMDKLAAASAENGEPSHESQAEPEAEQSQEQENQEQTEHNEHGANGNHEPSAEYKAMDEFITQCESSSPEDWSKAWHELQIPRQAEMEMLTLLFEVVVNKDMVNKESGFFDFVPKVVIELIRSRQVFNKNVELALKVVSRRMEDLAQVNDQAWHLLSYMMLYLYPKGRGTDWGLFYMAWTWETWWKTTKEVLGAAQKYRAFDILVLLLQLMQEKSEQVLKSLPAWSDPSKTAKAREVLCQWGDMDEAAILETLSAYGVEL